MMSSCAEGSADHHTAQGFPPEFSTLESQGCCSLLARRTAPLAALVALVAMRLGEGKLLELLLFLPLFQPGPILCQHQEIRRVRDGQGPSRFGRIAQRHGGGLT